MDLLNTKEYSLLIDTTFKHNDFSNVNPKCVVPENIHSPSPRPHGGHLSLCSLHPAGISFQEVLVICHSLSPPPPHPLEFPVIFQLGWVPSRKNICVKMLLHYIIIRKIFFFGDKMRKKSFQLCWWGLISSRTLLVINHSVDTLHY